MYQSFDGYPILEISFWRSVASRISICKLKLFGIKDSLLEIFESFLGYTYQPVLLNGQESYSLPVNFGIPQGSLKGTLFLIYVNNLYDNLTSTVKLLWDDTSIFSTVLNDDTSMQELNKDLKKFADMTYSGKMQFNPDVTK